MSVIKRGDYFLMPLAGPRKDRLIQAVRPWLHGPQWYVVNAVGMRGETIVLLSSCRRCGPKLAKAIIRTARR